MTIIQLRVLMLWIVAVWVTQPVDAADPKPTKPIAFEVKVTGQGPPIIFIPGLTCSGEVWNDAVKHFSPKYECHVMTLGGFAGVKPFEGPFLETVRDGIVDYIKDKKLAKPVIIGHSIGGFLCYMLGLAAPDHVGPLIPIDGMPSLAALINPKITPDELKSYVATMRKQSSAITREEFLKQQDATLTNWIADKSLRETTAKWGAASDQKTVAAAMADMMGRDLRGEVSKIQPRMLIVTAPVAFFNVTKDEARKRYDAQLESIPNKTVVYAEKSNHFVMYDEPEWLWKQIDEFLAAK